ncbi:glycosyltransferase family 4 protein [Ligilactobacillus ceti]|uniref:Glycosyltransferase, group 1 family protein n=1 Tax=Ligilactobacillus ceti DSM 22408 TaxID=1122146 RepID=A0A0R2KTM6_9LACO|nr:glycosyltransferase family 4 protein [Ligilactobacillus ceti]KRN90380.1 glycosyltransferase, group 1 family protein [Ligilactobacillus ceti DSM 22408]
MNIGIFTDTYYPQVSGVATSIRTLSQELQKQGHQVYIFTTTDPNVDKEHEEKNIFRFASIPFVSFTDRRIAFRGYFQAYQIAKDLDLDIVHTQTEFSMGLIGKSVAKHLEIPCVHTYHTMYEDYLHYIAKGKLLKSSHVQMMTRTFCAHLNGVVAPSEKVVATLQRYGIDIPMQIIPTGINITKFQELQDWQGLREKYQITPDQPVILTLSRLAYEKNINKLISAFNKIQKTIPEARLIIVGDGPARDSLEEQVVDLELTDKVIFTGEISNDEVAAYYQMADLFASTSKSESQGLTYIEALAAGLYVLATESPYTNELLDDESLGAVFTDQADLIAKAKAYLQHPADYQNQKVRNEKLHLISAEYFAEQVLAFYQASQDNFAKKEIENKTE